MMSCSALPTSHVSDVTQENPQSKPRGRDVFKVESTADGDVRTFVVEPSFDADDATSRHIEGDVKEVEDSSPKSSNQDAQSRSDEDDHQSEGVERRLSPTKEDQPRTHSRNLSAHFFDAAKISEEAPQSVTTSVVPETFPVQHSTSLHSKHRTLSTSPSHFSSNSAPRGSPVPTSEGAISFSMSAGQPPVSPAMQVGGKHRRGISGDIQSPANAHRRINSIGNSAPIDRRYGGYHHYDGPPPDRDGPSVFPVPNSRAPSGSTRHQREDSAGLDMLTAAAMEDVSKEELAGVAGPRGREGPAQTPWEPPVDSNRAGGRIPSETLRVSPTAGSSGSYGYPQQHSGAQTGPPPPSGSGYFPAPQPPHRGFQGSASPTNVGPQYPPGPYHHHHPSYYPPPHYHHRGPSPTAPYPVQYSQPRAGGHDPYSKQQHPPMQPVLSRDPSMGSGGRHPSPSVVSNTDRIETDERLFARGSPSSMAPPPSAWERPGSRGTTTGVQTHVTAISVGEDRKTIQPTAHHRGVVGAGDHSVREGNPLPQSIPTTVGHGHHRKLSSFSSLSGLMSNSFFPEAPPDNQSTAQPGAHHRTASSVSFLQGLDESDPFIQSLNSQAPSSNGHPAQSFAAPQQRYAAAPSGTQNAQRSAEPATANAQFRGRALAAGGTSKRIRRKCTVADCPNRVVQGGLCISHGAKRKTCKHPGCTKNVKKAGLCSTHGPARKRCDAEGCTKVAVQGGKCIAHGAKKKLCSIDGCTKQAILGGMCKKHHDQHNGIMSSRGGRKQQQSNRQRLRNDSASPSLCVEIDSQQGPKPTPETKPSSSIPKSNHRRGLSIFQEMSADSVKILLSDSNGVQPIQEPVGQQPAVDSFGGQHPF